MDFALIDLNDEITAFWGEVRSFFDDQVTEEVLEEERRGGGGFSPSLHAAMGRRGWVAPTWPVEEGGASLDSVHAKILRLEMERSGAPWILASTTLLPPVAIRLFGSEQLKNEILPKVADGSVRICLGYTEPDCGSDLAAVRTRAIQDGDEWIISGQKMFTTGAQYCQYCFCLTRTNPAAPKHKGLTVFLVPLDLPGIEIRPIGTLGGEVTNFVYFDEVRVSDGYRIGDIDRGWTTVSAPLNAEHGMADEDSDDGGESGTGYVKSTMELHDAVLEWARHARDSEGSLMINDVVVRERLATVAAGIEAVLGLEGPMARIASSEKLMQAASDLLQLVGPGGLLTKGQDGDLMAGVGEATFRYAPGTGIYGGTTDIYRNLIGEQFLGLPRSTPRVPNASSS